MLATIVKLFAFLPLSFIQSTGGILGLIFNRFSPNAAKNRMDNFRQSGLYSNEQDFTTLLQSNIRETGKSILETLYIWSSNNTSIASMIKEVDPSTIATALAKNKGIIFLTPHLGCFEITSRYYALAQPITILYRPPKKKWLLPLMNAGRTRHNINLAPANTQGVRKLIQALKRGEAIGILPDQIPAAGEGDWADFFGKPAYTMTLASKLAEKTGASVIMAFGERLADGQGYVIHLTEVPSIATPTLLNQAIQQQIAKKPEQYLWQYNRYKIRKHAKPLADK